MSILKFLKFEKQRQNFDEKLLLYVIGAQKAGTTWLWDYFKNHRQVYVSYFKEMQYFNCKHNSEIFKNTIASHKKNLDLYLNKTKLRISKSSRNRYDAQVFRELSFLDESYYIKFFKKYVSDEICFADITPGYSGAGKEAYKKMNSLHPNTKFLFIMRDPLDRFCSCIKHTHKISRLNDNFVEECINSKSFEVRSNYKSTIENLEEIIDKEKILYLFYEDLFCDESIKTICDFLGIKFKHANYKISVNRRKYEFKFSDHALKKIFDSQRPVYNYIFEKFQERTPKKWYKTYEKWKMYK